MQTIDLCMAFRCRPSQQQPGVSLKQLMKNSKAKKGAAGVVADSGTHHSLFLNALKVLLSPTQPYTQLHTGGNRGPGNRSRVMAVRATGAPRRGQWPGLEP